MEDIHFERYLLKISSFLLFSIFTLALSAQNGPLNSLSPRSNGISNASVAFNDLNSIFNNQAGLADVENIGLLSAFQQTFVNPNSDNFGIGLALPTSSGTFGIDMHYFASKDLDQVIIGLAYARKLSPKLSAGIQFEVRSSRLAPYDRRLLFSSERKRILTAEIGLQYKLQENFLLGLHFSNPTKRKISEDEYSPRIIRAGASYSVSNNFLVHAELEKDFDFPLVFKSGLEWELVDELWFRTGFQITPININLGTGYKFKNGLKIDLACYYQAESDLIGVGVLALAGFIPSLGFSFDSFQKK